MVEMRPGGAAGQEYMGNRRVKKYGFRYYNCEDILRNRIFREVYLERDDYGRCMGTNAYK